MIVNQNCIIADLETSGFNPKQNAVTQIAFVVVDSFNFEEKCKFNTYVKPYDNKHIYVKQAADLTGITQEKCIEEGRPLNQVVEEMSEIFKKFKVSYYLPYFVGHNFNAFDIRFLEDIYDRIYGPNSGKNGTNKLYDFATLGYDTMFLARQKFTNNEVPNFKLNTVGEYLGLYNKGAHLADNDVDLTLEVFKYFIQSLRQSEASIQAKKREFTFQF